MEEWTPTPTPKDIPTSQNLWIWPYLEKSIFVNVIKDPKMRTSWLIQLGAKSNEECRCKRQKSQKRRRLREDWCRDWGGAVKEAEACLQSPEAGKIKERSSPTAFRGLQPDDTLILFVYSMFLIFFFARSHSLKNVSSLTRDGTLGLGPRSPDHWTIRGFPTPWF